MDSHSYSDHKIQPCIHYVETLPSVLQEMPWVHQVKHKVCVINRIVVLQSLTNAIALLPLCSFLIYQA